MNDILVSSGLNFSLKKCISKEEKKFLSLIALRVISFKAFAIRNVCVQIYCSKIKVTVYNNDKLVRSTDAKVFIVIVYFKIYGLE